MSLHRTVLLVVALGGVSGLRAANCPLGGTAIYFGNGINTDTGHAVASVVGLAHAVQGRLNVTGNSLSQVCLTFNLAPDFEFVDSSHNVVRWANMAAQLVDAAAQKGVELTPSLLWGWLNAVTPPPDWFTSIVSYYATNTVQVYQPDLQLQKSLYQAEINSGNDVIVVAHSQGNLYVNQAYILLGTQASQLSVVALASPAAYVAGSGKWFTLYNDIITLVPGSLSANIGNDPPSPCLAGDSIGCHSFDNSYLSGDNTGPALLDAVISNIPFSSPGPVTVGIGATLDGSPWPSSGTSQVSYTIVNPQGVIIGQSVPGTTGTLRAGQYSFTYQSGSPPNTTFLGISPCPVPSLTPNTCNLTVAANETFQFTLRFKSNPPTAGFLMSSGTQSKTDGQTLNMTVASGDMANVNFDATSRSSAANGNTITNWTWTAGNSIIGTTSMFSKSFPVGTYTIGLVLKDSRGIQSPPVTATLVVSAAQIGPTGSMIVPRFGHTSTLLKSGLVLVTGGYFEFGPDPFTSIAELYNPQTGSWRSTASPMNTPRGSHTATRLADGRVLIAGGIAGGLVSNLITSSAELFDPVTETFTPVGNMNLGRVDFAAVLLDRGKVLVVGGQTDDPFRPLTNGAAEIYDPVTQHWTFLPNVDGHGDSVALAPLPNGRVLIIGGGFSNKVDLFDPVSATSQQMTPLLYPRWQHSASTLPDGTVLVAGGNDAVFTGFYTAEVYDVTANNGTGKTTLVPGTLTVGSSGQAAVNLPDGNVLLAGGQTAPPPVSTNSTANAQLYSFRSKNLSSAPAMLSPRARFSMILLSNGQVLICGGVDVEGVTGTILSACEVR